FLPPIFSRVHPRVRTPYIATALAGVAVAVLAGIFAVATLVELVALGTLFAFVVVCVGVIVLRRRAPDAERRFRAPAVPWLPLLGAGVCFYMMTGLPWSTWARFAVWLTVGLTIYCVYGRGVTDRCRSADYRRAPMIL